MQFAVSFKKNNFSFEKKDEHKYGAQSSSSWTFGIWNN